MLLVTRANMLTMEFDRPILHDHALFIDSSGRIMDMGPSAELEARYPQTTRIDAQGRWVMPGKICAHTHFYGAFARGLAIPPPAPKDFPEILQRLWWPLDQALDEEAVELSALIMLVDAIRNGTTTLFDHHASPNALEGSLDIIADAVDKAGVRAALAYEVTDRYGPQKAQAAIQENVRFIERLRRERPYEGRIIGLFGLHASLTLSDATLAASREAARPDVGFHIHVAEHEADEYDSLAKSGTRVVDRLMNFGILGPRTIVAHAVHVDAREIFYLAETQTWVSHQPRSNMNNGVGVAPVESLMRAGIRVVLGTDGFPHAMWEEARVAYLLHKVAHRDPRRMDGKLVAEMAFANNAALSELHFGLPIGQLIVGAVGDLIIVDYDPPTPITEGNWPWHILFGMQDGMVRTTIVDGRVLMRDRELQTLDEEAIFARARAKAPEVWQRYQEIVAQGGIAV
ncbi:MAG: putative aminohydrolase SsnA [Chloroflexi bacterium]|nr:putative aminohydrolase SsnA [Chloroflexota bacterium]